MLAVVVAAETLTFEAGHVLKSILKLWSNLKLNILMNFVLKKKKVVMAAVVVVAVVLVVVVVIYWCNGGGEVHSSH